MSSFKAAVRRYLADAGISDEAGEGDEAEPEPFVAYAFPLRQGREAQLELPRDITATEAERLCAFVHSLVIER